MRAYSEVALSAMPLPPMAGPDPRISDQKSASGKGYKELSEVINII